MSDWANDTLDADYLLRSGLLFEANRTFFHLLGISLTARQEGGKTVLGLKDFRKEPQALTFDRTALSGGQERLRVYLRQFGHAQMERRCVELGWACQPNSCQEKQA